MNNPSSCNQLTPIKHTAKKKIGVVARIKADIVGASTIYHWFINTTKTPGKITAGTTDLFIHA